MKKFGLLISLLFFSTQMLGQVFLTESFETGLPTAYSSTTSYTLGSGIWTGQANGVIRGTVGVKSGTYSCQLRNQTGAQITTPNITGGISTVTFWASSSTTSGSVQVNYSTDGGTSWNAALGSPFSLTTGSAVLKTATVNSNSANILVQFYRTAATVYLDDVTVNSISILPTITVNPTSLVEFTYILGSGPSSSQSYNLSGSNLTPTSGNLTVNGSTNYEVSTDNSSFSTSANVPYSGGALSSTTIYVRLKSGLLVGSYNSEVITNAGGGVTTQNVTVSGTVILPSLPIEENFSYNTGTLTNVSGNSWKAFSGAGLFPVQVTANSLTFFNYPSSNIGNKITIVAATTTAEDVSKNFSSQSGDGTKVYASFLINLQSAPTSANASYFASLYSTAGTGGGYKGRLFAQQFSSNFQIGLSSDGNTGTYLTNLLDYNTTYLIVISYEFVSGNNDVVRLWLNPSLTGNEPTPDLELLVTTDFTYCDAFALRQAFTTGVANNPDAEIDGLRISNSWSQAPLPVELSSFSASIVDNAVKLNWGTETEVNNYGFEILRQAQDDKDWTKIGFVNGNGNSNSPKSYSFTDTDVLSGKYYYRLKQIDNDGQYEYSKTIEVDLGTPSKFELAQNFPNPFNPETSIRFTLPVAGNVRLTIYNLLGQEVKSLVNEYKEAGTHIINFSANGGSASGGNASELNSGVYIYKLEANGITQTRKMTLIK